MKTLRGALRVCAWLRACERNSCSESFWEGRLSALGADKTAFDGFCDFRGEKPPAKLKTFE
eukprot:7380978-Prymnesium_polylepis.5